MSDMEQNTVKIDGNTYAVESLPSIARVAIDHLMMIDKEQQRLEMARAGFAQAVKTSMEGEDAPEPIATAANDAPESVATAVIEDEA